MSFINKVVLITGAGSGIGEAIALNFAKLSARLALIDLNMDNLYKVTEQCENLSKTKVFKVLADVSNDGQIEKAVNSILIEYAKIDVVINCAGISGGKGILDADVMSVFDKVLDVNLRSMVAVTHFTGTALIESKGCIINIASVMARTVSTNAIPYNVSKAGVVHFTKSIAYELAEKGVRVNCISPGPVPTNIILNAGRSQEESDKLWDGMAKMVPLRHNIKAGEIAELAAYLASDKARSITGANFLIDSGLALSGVMNATGTK